MTQHARITTLVAAALVTSLVSGACQAETAQQRGKVIAQAYAAAMPLRQSVIAPIPPPRASDLWTLGPI